MLQHEDLLASSKMVIQNKQDKRKKGADSPEVKVLSLPPLSQRDH